VNPNDIFNIIGHITDGQTSSEHTIRINFKPEIRYSGEFTLSY
jgi:hypothetical protein